MTIRWRSDEELVAATRDDPDAFGLLYRRHVAGVLAYFMRRTGDPEVATDLAAEVFVAALEGGERYDSGRAPVTAWLYGIARNVLGSSVRRGRVEDRARRRLRVEPLELDDDALARVEDLGSTDDARLHELLGELPEPQREAIIARIVREDEYSEIAASLQCSEAVVRKRVSRGLSAIHARLQEDA